MKTNRLGKILCLLIIVIIVFSGCSTGKEASKQNSADTNTSKPSESAVQSSLPSEPSENAAQNSLSSNEPSQSTVQKNEFNNECWNNIKTYSSNIGKTFYNVAIENGIRYDWYGDNRQSAYSIENVYCYFPQLIWDNSVCSAAAIEGDYIISDDVKSFKSKDIEAYFGTGYSYHAALNNKKGYYEYELDNFKALVFETPEEGIALSEMYVLIESKNETVGLSEIISNANDVPVVLEPERRDPDKWGGIDAYINKLGKDKSEVLSDEISWNYEEDSNYYRDPNSNYGYSFDKFGKCNDICIPIKLLINAQNSENLTMKDIAVYFNIPFAWFTYEGADYKFSFKDIIVFIPSDDDGQVDDNAMITIIKGEG